MPHDAIHTKMHIVQATPNHINWQW
jgi:hypothetical protein